MTDDATAREPETSAAPAVTQESPDHVELELPEREPTGDDAVDTALDDLDRVRGDGLRAHLDAAEQAQEALQRRLADTGD